jgi:hypothetical protein
MARVENSLRYASTVLSRMFRVRLRVSQKLLDRKAARVSEQRQNSCELPSMIPMTPNLGVT